MMELNEGTMTDYAKLLNSVLSLGGISVMAAASRTILSEDRRSLTGFLRGLVLALFVAVMVGWGLQGATFSQDWKNVIIGVTAFTADDLLLILLSVTAKLREDPMIIIDYLLRLLPTRGVTQILPVKEDSDEQNH